MQGLFIFVLLIVSSCSMENMLEDEFYECAKCLCHSVSGCWFRENCARYSINQTYWEIAGEPTINFDVKNKVERFSKCMNNENCIVTTIKKYTDNYIKDCNCDGKIDCKDRLAIHLGMRNDCRNPHFSSMRANRFNRCASRIGVSNMEVEEAYCGAVEAE